MSWQRFSLLIVTMITCSTVSMFYVHREAQRLYVHQNEIMATIGGMHGETLNNSVNMKKRLESLNDRFDNLQTQLEFNAKEIIELQRVHRAQ